MRLWIIFSYFAAGIAGLAVNAEAQSFKGYSCTVDCSGHEAGYEWAEQQGITSESDCNGNSNSFNEGCQAWAEEQSAGSGSSFGIDANGGEPNSGEQSPETETGQHSYTLACVFPWILRFSGESASGIKAMFPLLNWPYDCRANNNTNALCGVSSNNLTAGLS